MHLHANSYKAEDAANRKITSGKEKKNGTYFEKKMVAKVEFLRRRDRRYLHGNAYVVKACSRHMHSLQFFTR